MRLDFRTRILALEILLLARQGLKHSPGLSLYEFERA